MAEGALQVTAETACLVYDRLLPGWREARLASGQRRVTCPLHPDKDPSLDVEEARGVWICRAGCGGGGAIDLARRVLGEEGARELLRSLGNDESSYVDPRWSAQSRTTGARSRREVAAYAYRDAEGTVAYEVVRYEPKTFRIRRPNGRGGWIWNLENTQRVLYRLPELIAADTERPVYVVEGEKDADSLARLGFVVTTNAGGAGKWRDEYNEPLRGRSVVILPDNDAAGREHAAKVAGALEGIAATIRVVNLPALPEKGDVGDFLAAGGTREQLEALVAKADSFPASKNGGSPESNSEPEDPRWRPISIDDLPDNEEQIPWVLDGYLASGAVTLLVGLWKAGKTTWLVHLLRAITAGDDTFAGQSLRKCHALVVSEEPAMLWRQRRHRFGLSGIDVVCRPFLRRPDQHTWERFIAYLAQTVRRQNISLVVFDPLANLWPVNDENDAGQVTAALVPLRGLEGAAVLLVHHPRKGDAGEGQAARGSGALPGFVEIIVELRRFDAQRREDTRRVLTSYSRFDDTPPELVVDYDPERGYEAIGTKRDATAEDRFAIVRRLVVQRFQTAEEIGSQWPVGTVPKPGLRTLSADLKRAFEQGQLARRGAGVKGDPHQYGLSTSDSQDADLPDSIPASSNPYLPESHSSADSEEEATWTR